MKGYSLKVFLIVVVFLSVGISFKLAFHSVSRSFVTIFVQQEIKGGNPDEEPGVTVMYCDVI